MSAPLRVRGLCVERGGRRVLDAVDLDVPEAQVTALLGPNGAGKTTLVLALAGLLPITAGDVELDGVALRGRRPEDIRSLGLAAVPEGHRVLTKLMVDENLRVAAAAPGEIERGWSAFPELVPGGGSAATARTSPISPSAITARSARYS